MIDELINELKELQEENKRLKEENKLVWDWLTMYNMKLDKIKDIINWFHEEM